MTKHKIILINTGLDDCFKEGFRERYNYPPFGLLNIASILSAHGYNVSLIDFFSESISKIEFIDRLKKDSDNIIAIGITTYTESFHLAISTAEIIKQILPKTKIILGGVHVSFKPNEGLEKNVVDFIVKGEGESKIITLLEYIKHPNLINPNDIKGISFKNKENKVIHTNNSEYITSLDCLPLPSYYLIANNPIYSKTISIVTSRGCPGKCNFCASREFNGKKFRMHSAIWIFSLLYHYFHKINKFTVIDFMDDTFTVNKKRVNQLHEILKFNKCNYIWSCKSRTDFLDEISIKLLAKSGCRSIHLGIESSDQKILDSIDKNINHKRNLEILKLCYKYSIRVECSFMIGLPKDTKETIDKTLIFASELLAAKIGLTYVGIATPFPGTKMFENSDTYGMKFTNYNWRNYTTRKPIYYTDNFSIEDIRNAYHYFNFDKKKLEGKNIISSCDLSDFRNGTRSWIKEVIECKRYVQ